MHKGRVIFLNGTSSSGKTSLTKKLQEILEFVRVNCPLDELERREKARGDRDIGQAKFQLERIHGHRIYDIEVNTYENSIDECAKQIINTMDNIEVSAFRKLYDRNLHLRATQDK